MSLYAQFARMRSSSGLSENCDHTNLCLGSVWLIAAQSLAKVLCSESSVKTFLDVCRAHGYRLDYDAFIASFSSSKARALLLQLRQSQCLEVFINERLLMASKGFADKDDFESKVGSQLDLHVSACKARRSCG